MVHKSKHWINKLSLVPHPEGGFYKKTYKSNVSIALKNENNATASLIYFLLDSHQISCFHKLTSDEVWIHHSGSAVRIFIINQNGELITQKLGADIENDEQLQVLVMANTWFAAELIEPEKYSLMTCMVTPAFQWNEFEMGKKNTLCSIYPQHASLINKLCKY